MSAPRKASKKPGKSSPSGKKGKPIPVKMSKGERELCDVLRRELAVARFDSKGFRIHTPAGLDRWNGAEIRPFPEGARPEVLRDILQFEMCRECEWAYRYQSDFLSFMAGEMNQKKFKEAWPFLMMPVLDLFPLPSPQRFDEAQCRALKERPSAIREIPENDAAECLASLRQCHAHGFLPFSQAYFIEINWSAGIEAVREDLLEWVKNARPERLPNLRGRKAEKDHLHALAAYRARRAGLNYSCFPGIYSDQPQFLRACGEAERRLHKFDCSARAALYSHQENSRPLW
jgi:hypothetical protein